jgi:hypothetical protein
MKWLAVAAVLWAAAPARGQEAGGEPPRAELFAGYSFVHSQQQSLNGWNASLALGLGGRLALLGDLSGHYGSGGRSQLNLMAGPGLTLVRGSSAVLFVHALFGLHRETVSLQVFDVSISESESHFGMQFGGGLDIGIGGAWALRGQGDYQWIHEPSTSGGTSVSGLRLSAGVVYRLGHH